MTANIADSGNFKNPNMFNVKAAATTTGGGGSHNPMHDVEVSNPPDDCISCLEFGPAGMPGNFIISGSWANDVRCWQIENNGQTTPKAQQSAQGPILDVCWGDEYSKVFMASVDKTARMWDLGSNQTVQFVEVFDQGQVCWKVAQHDAPIKTCHWIKAPNYSCLMTGSWDKTLKFWDTRQATPMKTIKLSERVYCADVKYPMAMVGCADKLICLKLDNQPSEFRTLDSPMKLQSRCISIIKDKSQSNPVGYALGSTEGRVAIQYIQPTNPKDNFLFKCHRSLGPVRYRQPQIQDIYAVNAITVNPVYGTLATCGSDGKFSFWDKDQRTKLKGSEQLDLPIPACAINSTGSLFAYAASYDWSKGHEFYDPKAKNRILLRSLGDDMKPRKKT